MNQPELDDYSPDKNANDEIWDAYIWMWSKGVEKLPKSKQNDTYYERYKALNKDIIRYMYPEVMTVEVAIAITDISGASYNSLPKEWREQEDVLLHYMATYPSRYPSFPVKYRRDEKRLYKYMRDAWFPKWSSIKIPKQLQTEAILLKCMKLDNNFALSIPQKLMTKKLYGEGLTQITDHRLSDYKKQHRDTTAAIEWHLEHGGDFDTNSYAKAD